MTPERVQRKLKTILAVDVEGYSRLVDANEEVALKTLAEYRDIIDTLANRIRLLYEDLERRRQMGTAARACAMEFTWQRYRSGVAEIVKASL